MRGKRIKQTDRCWNGGREFLGCGENEMRETGRGGRGEARRGEVKCSKGSIRTTVLIFLFFCSNGFHFPRSQGESGIR